MKVLDPTDPELWKARSLAYDDAFEPHRDLLNLGFEREELLGLLFLRGMRNIVVKQGLSLFITIEGRHRSGKSRFAVTMASLFSKPFEKNMEKYVVKDADELLKLVEHVDKEKIADPVIIVDEAGSALNSADWFEKIQKAIIKTLTVIGYLHPTILFIAPIKDLILSGIRKMSHIHILVKRSTNAYTTVIPYEVHYNSLRGKAYFKKFKLNFLGMPIRINSVRATLPPAHIDAAYNKLELERKPLMLQDIRNDAMKAEVKAAREVPDLKSLVAVVVKNYQALESERSKPGAIRLDPNLIATMFRVPYRFASAVQKLAQKQMNDNVEVDMLEIQEGADDSGSGGVGAGDSGKDDPPPGD